MLGFELQFLAAALRGGARPTSRLSGADIAVV
jgi:hypothetical protein